MHFAQMVVEKSNKTLLYCTYKKLVQMQINCYCVIKTQNKRNRLKILAFFALVQTLQTNIQQKPLFSFLKKYTYSIHVHVLGNDEDMLCDNTFCWSKTD